MILATPYAAMAADTIERPIFIEDSACALVSPSARRGPSGMARAASRCARPLGLSLGALCPWHTWMRQA
jgi:hypothetical protein